MAFKPIRIQYQARNNKTGLTNVKAQVYLNEVAKAVGVSALVLSELDATNAPGVYYYDISSAQLVTWGAANGDQLEIAINSATDNALAITNKVVETASVDSLEAHLVSQDADIAAVKGDTAAIKLDIEDGVTGLAAIKALVDSVSSQVGALQNNTSFEAFVPESGFIKPTVGTKTYRIPINIQKENGSVGDADSNSITVACANVAGTDRGSIMTGYAAGVAPAVRDAAGRYHIDITLGTSSVEEELIFTFTYAMNAVSFAKQRAAIVVNDVQAAGLALEASVQTAITDIAAVQSTLDNGTYGLSAAKTQQDAIKSVVDANAVKLSDIEGAGFATLTDSLAAISACIYVGGRAV